MCQDLLDLLAFFLMFPKKCVQPFPLGKLFLLKFRGTEKIVQIVLPR